MKQLAVTLHANQLPYTTYGNDEITCGNVYSTAWRVTAYEDVDSQIAGDADYDICAGFFGAVHHRSSDADVESGDGAVRYNNRRDMNDGQRFQLAMSQIGGKRLTYSVCAL